MPSNPSMSAAIVAAAESDKIGYIEEGTTALMLHIEAIRNVCDQAGISPAEIEGVFAPSHSALIAEYLGLHPKYIDTTAVGGCSLSPVNCQRSTSVKPRVRSGTTIRP